MERQLQPTAETASEAPAGMTFTSCSQRYGYAATIELDCTLKLCRVSIHCGDSEYTSEWLALHTLLEQQGTVEPFRAAAKHSLALVTSLSRGRSKAWTPLELWTVVLHSIEHWLA